MVTALCITEVSFMPLKSRISPGWTSFLNSASLMQSFYGIGEGYPPEAGILSDIVHTSSDSLILIGNFGERVIPEFSLSGGSTSEDKLFIGILNEDSEIIDNVIFYFHCDLARE